jgi:uncharacterized membrane protein HdeD (DUF308 family)
MATRTESRLDKRNWWVMALQGLLVTIFGVLVLSRPVASAAALVLTFGAVIGLEGIVAIVSGVTNRQVTNRGVLIAMGVVSLLAGVATLAYPGMAAVALYSVIAAWAIIRGALTMYAGSQVPPVTGLGPWMYVTGVAEILFGVLMIARPVAGFAALMTLIGVSAIVIGVLEIATAFRVRSLGERVSITMARAEQAAGERLTPAGRSDLEDLDRR